MADWRKNIKEKIKQKRTGKPLPASQVIKVQRMSADVSGAWQKFSRVGPLQAVRMRNDEELTIESLKEACKAAFQVDLEAELLASERGPGVESLEELQLNKVVHVRFFVKEADIAEFKPANQKRKLSVSVATTSSAPTYLQPISTPAKVSKRSLAVSVPQSHLFKFRTDQE